MTTILKRIGRLLRLKQPKQDAMVEMKQTPERHGMSDMSDMTSMSEMSKMAEKPDSWRMETPPMTKMKHQEYPPRNMETDHGDMNTNQIQHKQDSDMKGKNK